MLLRLGQNPSDQAAWEEFVDRYGEKIYSWCRAWQLQGAAWWRKLKVWWREPEDEPSPRSGRHCSSLVA